ARSSRHFAKRFSASIVARWNRKYRLPLRKWQPTDGNFQPGLSNARRQVQKPNKFRVLLPVRNSVVLERFVARPAHHRGKGFAVGCRRVPLAEQDRLSRGKPPVAGFRNTLAKTFAETEMN